MAALSKEPKCWYNEGARLLEPRKAIPVGIPAHQDVPTKLGESQGKIHEKCQITISPLCKYGIILTLYYHWRQFLMIYILIFYHYKHISEPWYCHHPGTINPPGYVFMFLTLNMSFGILELRGWPAEPPASTQCGCSKCELLHPKGEPQSIGYQLTIENGQHLICKWWPRLHNEHAFKPEQRYIGCAFRTEIILMRRSCDGKS